MIEDTCLTSSGCYRALVAMTTTLLEKNENALIAYTYHYTMGEELKICLLKIEERMLEMEARMLKMEERMRKMEMTRPPKKEIKLPKKEIKLPKKETRFKTCDGEVVNVQTSLLKKSAYLDAFVSRWSGQHENTTTITTEHSKETMDHVHQLLCQPYISQDWDAQLEVAEYFGIDIHPSPFLLLQQGKFTVTRLGENSFNYSYFHPGTSKWLMAQIDKNRVTYFNRETREFSTVMCDMGQTFFDNTCYISGGMACILMTNLTEFHVIHLESKQVKRVSTDCKIKQLHMDDAGDIIFQDIYTDMWYRYISKLDTFAAYSPSTRSTRSVPPPPLISVQPHGKKLRITDALSDQTMYVGDDAIDNDITCARVDGPFTILLKTHVYLYVLEILP